MSSTSLSFTFGRYKPGRGRNAKIKMKVRMQKRAEMMRGFQPLRVAMVGAKAEKPVAAVYPIMFVEPRLSGGTLFSAIRNPTFYQAPILPTKMLFAM